MRMKIEGGSNLLKGLTILMLVITICIVGYGRKTFSERIEANRQTIVEERERALEVEAMDEEPLIENEENQQILPAESSGDKEEILPKDGQAEEVLKSTKTVVVPPVPVQKPVESPKAQKPVVQPETQEPISTENKAEPAPIIEEPSAAAPQIQEMENRENTVEESPVEEEEKKPGESAPAESVESEQEEKNLLDKDIPTIE